MKKIFKSSFVYNLFILLMSVAVMFTFTFATLTVYTNHGNELILPNITGKSVESAVAQLQEMNFKVIIDSVYEPRESALKVLNQSPENGAVVKPGRYVRLTVNRMVPLPMKMPDLKGLSYKSAEMLLRNNKLYVGDTTYVRNLAQNDVIEQSCNGKIIEPNAEIPQGSKIDLVISIGNHNPYITGGDVQTIEACEGEYKINLTKALAVTDVDKAQAATWQIFEGPKHGEVPSYFSRNTTGNRMTPNGINYTANDGFSGKDSFLVAVTDGIAADTTKIVININPKPNAGKITGYASVSPGDSVKLSSSVIGGSWATAKSKVQVLTNGTAKGLQPGYDTVTYYVANTCGISKAAFVLRVRPFGKNNMNNTAVANNVKTTKTTPTLATTKTIDTPKTIAKVETRKSNRVLPAVYFNIKPNGENGSFTVNLSSRIAEDARLIVTNLNGEKVKDDIAPVNNAMNLKIDAPAGDYYVTAYNAHGQWKERITVIK